MNTLINEFKEIIGEQHYLSFLALLKKIGPAARTHRISVVIASILQFAVNRLPPDCEEGSLDQAFVMLDEEPYLAYEPSEEYDKVYDLIDGLCHEAGMINERMSSKGEEYSISENAILEYTAWYNMPWEDY